MQAKYPTKKAIIMSKDERLRPYQLSTLLELVKLRAKDDYVQVKTSSLGKRLGISQQAASLHLKTLADLGLVSRKKSGGNRLAVKITEDGLVVVSNVYSELQSALEDEAKERNDISFHGSVFRGLGQASHFIGLAGYRKQFVKLLGFLPYPGSLNLRLVSPLEIYQVKRLKLNHQGIQLEGFIHGGREYAPLKCFKAVIDGSHHGAVLFTERTHYNDSVVEFISPEHLRTKLHLDEDAKQDRRVKVTVMFD